MSQLIKLCALFILFGWQAQAQTINIYVSILPQKRMVESIGGNRVSVKVLIPPGRSPEMYTPNVQQIVELAHADIFYAIGLPVENAIIPRIKAMMPSVLICHTETVHVDANSHSNSDADPHIWMDPVQMIESVEKIRDALILVDPQSAEHFQKNAEMLINDLETLHKELTKQLAPYKGSSFIINHPALGHFAKRYGLRQLSIQQSGKTFSARRIYELIEVGKLEGVGAVFSQPGFERSGAEVLAEALQVEIVEIDPLKEDYFMNMREIAACLERSFLP
jgi:zinc transport system substrate-binding protein